MFHNTEDVKNVALYTRVSTEDQAKEGFSLESQLDRLRNYCKSRLWNIIGEYVDDGHSGRHTKRPGYQKMLQDLKKFDAILVIKMDRIHRNSKNFLSMMDHLNREHKQFVSMTESFDTSNAMGRFVMQIVQLIAQLESEQIGERTYQGMDQKATKPEAGFNGHGTPYGYKIGRDPSDPKNTIIIGVPSEIRLVKRIFELAQEGNTINAISKLLKLPYSKVHYIAHNPWYAGYERFRNQFKKAVIKPIISVELFNDVQRKASKRTCNPKTRSKPLILPNNGADHFTIPREEYMAIAALRNIGSKAPKHKLS